MLRHADETLLPSVISLLRSSPEKSVRPDALLKAYGTGRPFFNIWMQDSGSAVLTRLDNTFSLVTYGGADFDEIAFFLEFNPYFQWLTGELDPVIRVASRLDAGFECIRHNLLRFGSPANRADCTVNRSPDLHRVFEVIKEDIAPGAFTAWYADMSHRIRHGCARAYLFEENGAPVSVCLVSAESDRAGLLSGVRTLPGYRSRGYARKVIGAACADLLGCGKVPVLECADGLLPFYKSIGFMKILDTAELTVSAGGANTDVL